MEIIGRMRGTMSKRKSSLIERGHLYAHKHTQNAPTTIIEGITSIRAQRAEDWKQGYLAARRDAKKSQ
jgi:hypothetical protein